MNDNNYITYLNYPLNMATMIKIADSLKPKAKPFKGKHHPFTHWKTVRDHYDPYIEKILNDFEVKGIPAFYWQEPNSYLKPHVDLGLGVSINFLLSEHNAPIKFYNYSYYYKQALLNTRILHSVLNGPEERILFKILVNNETFISLSKKIKFKLYP